MVDPSIQTTTTPIVVSEAHTAAKRRFEDVQLNMSDYPGMQRFMSDNTASIK